MSHKSQFFSLGESNLEEIDEEELLRRAQELSLQDASQPTFEQAETG